VVILESHGILRYGVGPALALAISSALLVGFKVVIVGVAVLPELTSLIGAEHIAILVLQANIVTEWNLLAQLVLVLLDSIQREVLLPAHNVHLEQPLTGGRLAVTQHALLVPAIIATEELLLLYVLPDIIVRQADLRLLLSVRLDTTVQPTGLRLLLSVRLDLIVPLLVLQLLLEHVLPEHILRRAQAHALLVLLVHIQQLVLRLV